MTRIGVRVTVIVALVLAGGVWATTRAQGLGQSSSGSLSELTAEVRQLRLTIAEAGKGRRCRHLASRCRRSRDD